MIGPAADLMGRQGGAIVETHSGARLAAKNVRLEDSKLSFDCVLLGHTGLPLEAVRAVYLPSDALTAAEVAKRCKELAAGDGRQDELILARSASDWRVVAGVLRRMDGANLTFNWQDADRTIERKGVRAVFPAMLGESPKGLNGRLTGRDGTILPFATLTMDAKHVTLDCPPLGKRKLARPDVAAIRFISRRVTSLVELKPLAVKEHGFLDRTFPHRLGRSAAGKPIRLDGKEYDDGLGLHSFCELTYDLKGAYKVFVARVGIDDAVRPRGDATVVILGEGKALTEPLGVTGRDKSRLLRLDVSGVKKLTIRVEFGADKLDVADHVDLASARLIK